MCAKIKLRGGKVIQLEPGVMVPVIGPKGKGRIRFDGFARVERRETWESQPACVCGIEVDVEGFWERNGQGDRLKNPIKGLGFLYPDGKRGFRILTREATPEEAKQLQHHRVPLGYGEEFL